MHSSKHRIDQLRTEAIRFRDAIDRCNPTLLRPVFFEKFPRGCCGDASDMLATYLHEIGLGEFEFVLAYRSSADEGTDCQHAWIEQDGVIVDITADQFEDAPQAVIVSLTSEWHATFTQLDSNRRLAGLDAWDADTRQRLQDAYEVTRRHIR